MSTEPALAALRAGTRAEHDRIEHLLRLDEPMALPRYATVMAGFEAFLAAWEPRMDVALPNRLQPWFAKRRRHPFALADVRWLAARSVHARHAMRADGVAPLPLDDIASIMGSLYVIEGSALGGRVIGPRLEKTLGLGPGHGGDYFHGFGDATGAMWRDFRLTASQEIGDSPHAIDRACEAARRTFAAMTDVFAILAPA